MVMQSDKKKRSPSVSRVLSWAIIYLFAALPQRSSIAVPPKRLTVSCHTGVNR